MKEKRLNSVLKKEIPGGESISIRALAVVNHAGELGAVMIYRGQADALMIKKNFALLSEIKKMLDSERIHLDYFESILSEYNIRPTLMIFVWAIIGYFFGFLSAFIGERLAMLLTESVEDVIVSHYEEQIKYLDCIEDFDSIKHRIKHFMLEELDHKLNAGLFLQDKLSFSEKMIKKIIKKSCRAAIGISSII